MCRPYWCFMGFFSEWHIGHSLRYTFLNSPFFLREFDKLFTYPAFWILQPLGKIEGVKLSKTAQDFFDFVTSPAANEIISAAGVVPVN